MNQNKNYNTESINNLRISCAKNAKHIKRVQLVMKKLINGLDKVCNYYFLFFLTCF